MPSAALFTCLIEVFVPSGSNFLKIFVSNPCVSFFWHMGTSQRART